MLKALDALSITLLIIPEVWLQAVITNTVTVTYAGDNSTVICPFSGEYTFPTWRGPPSETPYTSGSVFNKGLGEKYKRLTWASNKRDFLMSSTILEDDGVYKCTQFFNGSNNDGFNRVIVRVRPKLPNITTTEPEYIDGVRASEGQAFNITCISSGGKPAPNVVLYKDDINGEALRNTSVGVAVGLTYTVTLSFTLTPTRRDDQRQLICRSYYPTPENNQASQLTRPIRLNLYLKPSKPTLSPTVPVRTGKNITVECRTNGSRPGANIIWVLRDETMTGVTTITPEDSTLSTFSTVSVLQRSVHSVDNGQILTCRVSHPTGELSANSTLNIQFAVPSSSTRITGNRTIVANGTNPMLLECTTASSNPASNITWKKGNDLVIGDSPPSERRGENNGVIRSQVLTLKPTRDDNGEKVSCYVSSDVSSVADVASVTLALHYSPLIEPLTNQTVTEGDGVVLKCNARSKPAARFRWTDNFTTVAHGNGTESYNGLDLTVTNVTRTQAGTYTCNADNNIPPNDSKQTRLVVQYPPDVVVTVINTTVNSQSTTLTCGASGVPDNYTYDGWVHKFNGVEVLHQEPLPVSRDLTFTGLTYAHSGVYRCGASNGVKGVVSHGEETLLVKSFPVIIGNNLKAIKKSGQLLKPTVVTFQYYSNAGSGYVKVFKTNGSGEEVGEIHERSVEVKLRVFESEIATPGTEVTINITVAEENQFGEYQITVTNNIKPVNLSLVILPLGPPDTPVFVKSTILDHRSVKITWISGFPNGLNQTFIIQLSIDNSTWLNITQYGGMSFQQNHSLRIDDLRSSQVYFVRIMAVNGEGESQPTSIFRFQTAASTTALPVALIAGGVAGGIIAALVVIAVIVFIVWRRQKSPSGDIKNERALVLSSNHNEGYDAKDEEVINQLYESAGPRETETAVGASPSRQAIDGGDIYAKVDKKHEVVYAIPNKPNGNSSEKMMKHKPKKSVKGGKKTKVKTGIQTGDVYENAPDTMFGNKSTQNSGESAYEDTSITTSAAPKKLQGTDGLLYADLEFGPRKPGPRTIIGMEDRCEYTSIDLTKKAHPLPDSDGEDKN